jgi:hypothetical protein
MSWCKPSPQRCCACDGAASGPSRGRKAGCGVRPAPPMPASQWIVDLKESLALQASQRTRARRRAADHLRRLPRACRKRRRVLPRRCLATVHGSLVPQHLQPRALDQGAGDRGDAQTSWERGRRLFEWSRSCAACASPEPPNSRKVELVGLPFRVVAPADKLEKIV